VIVSSREKGLIDGYSNRYALCDLSPGEWRQSAGRKPPRIFLRLRHETPAGPADQDFLTPSFKVAVSLTEGAALALASELLSVVATRLKAPPASQDEEKDSEI
jgi:hypothetical protein